MSDYVIDTAGLQKQYGSRLAVADLTLQVPRGEVFGFLGPNGAGKSTAVKMLLGLVRASGGSARVLGSAPGTPDTLRRIGFLPEHFRFHEWMQARELLDFHGRLCKMDAATRRRRISAVLDLVGLTEHAHRPLSGFSKGMLQRVGLAQALLHEPELVFLDEPTSALDPFGRRLVRQIVYDLKASGITVFLNSHLLGEVEATCERVTFIREGRTLQTLALRDQAMHTLQVELRAADVSPALLAALEHLTGQALPASTLPPDGAPLTLDLTVPDESLLPQIAACTLQHGARLYALTPRRVSLEQRFLEIVGHEDSKQ
jgi:ABC-2 type transport system ATP-binding protein